MNGNNSVILCIMFYHVTYGWMPLPLDYTQYAQISFSGNSIRIYTENESLYGATIKIAVTYSE